MAENFKVRGVHPADMSVLAFEDQGKCFQSLCRKEAPVGFQDQRAADLFSVFDADPLFLAGEISHRRNNCQYVGALAILSQPQSVGS